MHPNQINEEKIFAFLKIEEYEVDDEITELNFISESDKVLEFNKSVVVSGNVEKSLIFINGNFHCRGDLHNSIIISLGNITIDGETSASQLHSNENIILNIVKNSLIFTESDLTIKECAHNSNVNIGGKINSPEATLYGGVYSTYNSILIFRGLIQSPDQSLRLIAGNKRFITQKTNLYQTIISRLEKKYLNLKEEIEILVRQLINQKRMGDNNPHLTTMKKQLPFIEKKLNKLRKELDDMIEYDKSGKNVSIIEVRSLLSENAIVEIGIGKYKVTTELFEARFRYDGLNIFLESMYN